LLYLPKSDNIWYPYTQMHDHTKYLKRRIIRSGRGFYFHDNEGNRYLDGISNMWCNVWGFNSNRITKAMINQIKQIPHSTIFGMGNVKSIEMSNEFLKLTKGLNKVFFTDNGSTAVEAALKIALQYWNNRGNLKKTSFLSIADGYHGDTIGAMSVGYVDKYFKNYKSLLLKSHVIPNSKKVTLDGVVDLKELDSLLNRTEMIIEKYADTTAALIMESGAQLAGGVNIYPNGYQRRINEMCKNNNILLILDEIATGFGRLGNMIEYMAQGSIPDIACYGKAITGGYFPLALTLTSNKIFQEFSGNVEDQKHLFHGHTYAGHPIGCTAIIENLKMYKENHLLDKIRSNSKLLKKRLQEFRFIPIVKNIRTKGLLAGFDLAMSGKPITIVDNIPINYFVMRESLKRGVLLRSLGETMIVIPPLAINSSALNKIMDTQLDIVLEINKRITN
jgi:adenosylmethionine-8-amino-7-oxononanoate aminotransferase